jgi:hypothetical protein
VVNRNLVILFVLLRPEFGLDEAAELATHLMYSAALPPSSAANLYRCINAIYNAGNREGDPIFQSDFNTRGRGKLHQMQVTTDMKEPMRMLLSKYTLSEGLKGMRNIMLSPSRVDYRDRYLAGLKPAHRLASLHFRERGVLVPFSVDVSHFTEPNR